MPVHDTPSTLHDADLAHLLGASRLRHMIAVIGTVARLSAKTAADVDAFSSHFEGRLGAMARALGMMLSRPRGLVDLHGLIADELIAHAAIEEEQFSVAGPEVWLGGRAIALVWLAVHELVVNSVKFGALSAGAGSIAVVWDVPSNASARLHLRWTEQCGPPAPRERRPGFGTEMIERRLAHELGGSGALAFTPSGLECVIGLPLGDEIRVVAAG